MPPWVRLLFPTVKTRESQQSFLRNLRTVNCSPARSRVLTNVVRIRAARYLCETRECLWRYVPGASGIKLREELLHQRLERGCGRSVRVEHVFGPA